MSKLIGDANRLRIMFAVVKGRKRVSEIAGKSGLFQSLVSFHLRSLMENGMLSTERRGRLHIRATQRAI